MEIDLNNNTSGKLAKTEEIIDSNNNVAVTSMKALRFDGKTKKVEFSEIPVPSVKKDEVLIEIAYAGMCGTDLHIIAGNFPCNPGVRTLGHEFSGIVVEIGEEVTNVTVGDRVAVNPNDGCTSCDHCHAGNPHYCRPHPGGLKNTIGIQRNGGLADYAVVPKNTVLRLPESISLEHGVLAEPISCLSHGWDLLLPVPIGSKILVIGAGVIGNLCCALLHVQGHQKVTVSEPSLSRLELLKKLDTGYTLITPDQLIKNQREDENYLFDVIIDCSGSCKAIEHAFTLLQLGGKMSLFGIAPTDGKISISPYEFYRKEARIIGVNINPYSFLKALGYMESMGPRYLDYDRLGIKVFKLEDYDAALKELDAGIIAKAVFKLI